MACDPDIDDDTDCNRRNTRRPDACMGLTNFAAAAGAGTGVDTTGAVVAADAGGADNVVSEVGARAGAAAGDDNIDGAVVDVDDGADQNGDDFASSVVATLVVAGEASSLLSLLLTDNDDKPKRISVIACFFSAPGTSI